MKYLIVMFFIGLTTLASELPKIEKLEAPIRCVEGVQYYFVKSSNYSFWSDSTYARAFLSPVVDSKTLTFKRCKGIEVKKK